MAPSATTTTSASTKRREPTANGNGSGIKLDGGVASEEREALEKKYKDFFWTYTEEPHRTRRLAIIKSAPGGMPKGYSPFSPGKCNETYRETNARFGRSRSFAALNL